MKDNDMNDILIHMFDFLQYYNNNYRPIYHMEKFIIYIIMKIHNYTEYNIE